MLVAVQLSVLGLYLPPVLIEVTAIIVPPQTIISLPLQTAVCDCRPVGRVGSAGSCPTVSAGIVSPTGIDRVRPKSYPPQTIISLPVHTAV